MNEEHPSTRQRIRRTISSISPKKWKIIAIIAAVVLIIIIVILAVSLYVILRSSGDDDPSKHLPPSSSPLKVYSKAAIVTLGEPCAEIGKRMLEKGGTVADAAIAAMLCVGAWVMQSQGVGGGFILTMYDQRSKTAYSLVARETAPAAATKDMFQNQSSGYGPQSVAVPGALKGYQELHRKFGKLPWSDLFQPTIELCENGIKVNKRLAMNFADMADGIKNSETFMDTILKPLGRIPKEGDILKLTQLAKTLRVIANSPAKADAFYKGELTKPFVQDMKEGGSSITEEDLNKYEVRWEEPINLTINGDQTVYTSSLPGAGVLLGFLLLIMEGVVHRLSTVEHANFLVEAFKHAFGRQSYLCDPRFVNKTVVDETIKRLKDEDYIKMVRAKIKPFWTTDDGSYYSDSGPVQMSGTDNIVVVDDEGSAISVTSSIHTWFGSTFVSRSTGILLNNHMADFSRPSNTWMSLNYPEPGKRPMSSMCPTVVVDSRGDVQLVVGAAGGSTIITAVAQVMEYNLFLGKDIKQAIDEPRFYNNIIPNEIVYEYGIIKDVSKSWIKTGYTKRRLDQTYFIAVVNGIARRGSELTANCDYRKYGSVDGY